MPQLRKDYILDRFTIIAKERGKRPKEFQTKKETPSPKKKCPFCPENEHMIPGVIDEIKNGKGWMVRAIWNKYKAADSTGDPAIKTDNEFYTYADAFGDHEVVIDTPRHGFEMEELPKEHIVKILEMLVRRINDGYSKEGIVYVSVFKNKGADAGASLSHSHHQIISYNLFPQDLKKEFDTAKDYMKKHGTCPYCMIIRSEKNSERRITEDDNFVVFSPYASRFPLEIWILPKRCTYSITDLNREEITTLANTLKAVLTRLSSLGSIPYNVLYRLSSPKMHGFHFRIEIIPRISKWAGFEHLTGTTINMISPEDAAKFYRREE